MVYVRRIDRSTCLPNGMETYVRELKYIPHCDNSLWMWPGSFEMDENLHSDHSFGRDRYSRESKANLILAV